MGDEQVTVGITTLLGVQGPRLTVGLGWTCPQRPCGPCMFQGFLAENFQKSQWMGRPLPASALRVRFKALDSDWDLDLWTQDLFKNPQRVFLFLIC